VKGIARFVHPDMEIRILAAPLAQDSRSRPAGPLRTYVTIPSDVTFRAKLLVGFILAIVISISLVAWGVLTSTRSAFETLDTQRTTALVEQFRREFDRRGEEVARRVAAIAETQASLEMAMAISQPNPDYATYVSDALGLQRNHQLDFVEMVTHEGVIFSSSHRPTKVLHNNEWVTGDVDWDSQGAFLRREEFPAPALRPAAEGPELGEGGTQPELVLVAVRRVGVLNRKVYIIGGRKLDETFLSSLVLPTGMRALLYRNLDAAFSPALLTGSAGAIEQPEKLQPLVERVRANPAETSETVTWSSDAASAETFNAIPLTGRSAELLGVLLVGSSRREMVEVQNFIRSIALVAGGVGVLLAVLLSWWAAARITHPVEQLAGAARNVAAGNWSVHVDSQSSDEIGDLARAFNQMTRQLSDQREKLLAAERVAAWRELARRLAHELKNPLHPLQITVENLQRARESSPEQFDEVFRESTGTLLGELENLKTIVARFSDFAKMPPPQPRPVAINDVVRNAVKLFDGQFSAPGRPQIATEFYLDENLRRIEADPDLLHRALQNLVLNAMDAMPAGGTLTVRTAPQADGVRIEISDTGAGLTPEECQRLFTPYYTSKHHGTGLGLAIVQSVISDHGGRLSVESEPEKGATFRLDLPSRPPAKVATVKQET
jgi:signal transduction histidine kinase